VWIGVGLIAVAAGALTLVWLRRADEVEISDQLWSSFVGLQVFAIGAPCWELLTATGAVPPVNGRTVYLPLRPSCTSGAGCGGPEARSEHRPRFPP
ncbi:MAG: hypothetical protein RJB55_210, partial [Verrucomicrobiota bacterium]